MRDEFFINGNPYARQYVTNIELTVDNIGRYYTTTATINHDHIPYDVCDRAYVNGTNKKSTKDILDEIDYEEIVQYMRLKKLEVIAKNKKAGF